MSVPKDCEEGASKGAGGEQDASVPARDSAKLKFLAEANHDLRQPLHAMSLFVSAVKERAEADPGQPVSNILGLIDKIDRSQRTVEDLLENLLDFSKLDSGLFSAAKARFQLADCFCQLKTRYRRSAREKEVSFRVVPSTLWVETDRQLFDRLIGCLIANAIKYTGQGKVLVGARRERRRVRVEVWDTGPGIDKGYWPVIFDPFTRFDDDGPKPHGLGLGLAIAREIASVLGAEIGFTSRVDKGSCFFVSLPLAAGEGDAARQGAGEPRIKTSPTILLVDDDPTVLDAMGILLEGWGYSLLAAQSADELRRLITREIHPALLLVDFRLGGANDGIQEGVRLKSELGGDFPIALMSGEAGDDIAARAGEHHMVLLRKPVKVPQLHQLIRSAVAGVL